MIEMKKILFFLFLLGGLVGCQKKEPLEPNTFQKKVEEKGYVVQDITDQKDREVTTIALLALHSDYEIEFYKLNSKESALSMYNMIRTKLEKEKKIHAKIKKNHNYQSYILETDQIYAVVSKIDNTILYGSTSTSHKKMLEEDIKSLGY